MFNYTSYLQAMHELDENTRNVRFIQACVGGEIEKVNLLLDNKDLNVDVYFKDVKGNDGFRWACVYKHDKLINELLVKYDYKISKRNLNCILKLNKNFNGALDFVLKAIESIKLNSSLNKSLQNSNIKSNTNKI